MPTDSFCSGEKNYELCYDSNVQIHLGLCVCLSNSVLFDVCFTHLWNCSLKPIHLKVIWIALYPLERNVVGRSYSRALWCDPALLYYPYFWNPKGKLRKMHLH